ncbi:MAG: response regulator [Pseudomonadota bacterium]
MRSILVLEDDPRILAWLATLAVEAFPGTEIREAATLEAGRRALAESAPDLALVDLSLPDGSGADLIAEAGEGETLFVVATIHDDDRHLFEALQAGASGYLVKDQPRERLVEQLRGITQGEPPLSPGIARRLLRFFGETPQAGPTTAPAPRTDGEAALSPREVEVLSLIARGYNRKDIARALAITPNTAAGYIKSVYRKLEVSGRAEATLRAVERGLVGGPGGPPDAG